MAPTTVPITADLSIIDFLHYLHGAAAQASPRYTAPQRILGIARRYSMGPVLIPRKIPRDRRQAATLAREPNPCVPTAGRREPRSHHARCGTRWGGSRPRSPRRTRAPLR